MMMCLLWSWSMTLSYSFFFAWDDVDGIKEAFLSLSWVALIAFPVTILFVERLTLF